MTYPTITAGRPLTIGLLSALRMNSVSQGSDQTVNNSTTMTATNLVIPVEAGAEYKYELWLSYTSLSSTAGIRIDWTVPAGTTMTRFQLGGGVLSTASSSNLEYLAARKVIGAGTDSNFAGSVTVSTFAALEYGIITSAATAGSVTFRFAQKTAAAVNTTVQSVSMVHYIRIG